MKSFQFFCSDFDHTLLNGTLLYDLCRTLGPQFSKVQPLCRDNDQTAGFKLFYQNLTKKGDPGQIIQPILQTMELNEGAVEILTLFKKLEIPRFIVSGSQEYIIQNFLQAKGYQHLISGVIANSTEKDIKGKFHFKPYHQNNPCTNGICAVEICKGEILSEMQKKGPLIFVGDGMNDFCPATKLSSSSLVFWRQGYPISHLLKERPELLKQVTAKIIWFKNLKEVLAHLEGQICM